jgi:hypothetical protein
MRKRIGTSALLAAMLVTSVAYTAPAAASTGKQEMPRYYEMAEFAAAGQEQCGKEISQRQGAWVCLTPPDKDRKPRHTPVGVDAGSVQAGICAALGCYYYYDSTYVYFDGAGSYGWWGTPLGTVYLYVEDVFVNGGNSTSKRFQFESTRGIKSLAASGERLYFSAAQPHGVPVSGNTFRSWGPSGPYPADALVSAFGSAGGYKAFENTVSWAGIAHQFQWTDPVSTFDGTWWVWWKSPKFQRQSNGNYTTTNPPTMGASWYGSGWDD